MSFDDSFPNLDITFRVRVEVGVGISMHREEKEQALRRCISGHLMSLIIDLDASFPY